jgi:23S rRNA pseudouridine2604 synthase
MAPWSNPAMASRTKISVKPAAPARDPRRPPVRGVNAPRPPAPRRDAPAATPAATSPASRPPRPQGPPRQQANQAPLGPTAAQRPRRADDPRSQAADHPPRPQAPGRPPRPQDRAPRPQAPDRAPRPQAAEHAPRPRAAAAPAAAHAEGARVAKLITERGLASRREADDWIAAGWVRVDGRLAVLGQRAAADARIEIDPHARAEQARRVTVLLHKPIGFVSGQAEDGHEPASVLVTRANRWAGDASGIELQPSHLRHLAPAGRLDIDSTGLLVLTQDGRIAKRLIGDETRVEKEYLVRVAYSGEGRLPDADLERLRLGLELDGVQLRPARVSWQNEDQLRFVLREGRKRQIRRMCEQVGLQVLGLKRVRIGSVSLGPLPPGQWRFLRDDESF